MKYKQFIGIFLGALYGFVYRLLCESSSLNNMYDYYDIYSISFIWVLPIVIGVIPILFAKNEIYKSPVKQFFYPILSVFLFFISALSTGIEDWLCILIIVFPFLFSAGIVGIIVSGIVRTRQANKFYTILFLPLILNPIENLFPNKLEYKTVSSEITINSKKFEVWDNIIEVKEIEDNDYNKGFFNYIGVPRPINSELKTIDGEQYRIGYFTDGLELTESISEIDTLNYVNFKIHIDKSKLRDVPTDNHLLKSNYFKFENINYTLKSQSNEQTKLILKCEYSLNSKMNSYANFWAKMIIKDFEEKLLFTLKNKIER